PDFLNLEGTEFIRRRRLLGQQVAIKDLAAYIDGGQPDSVAVELEQRKVVSRILLGDIIALLGAIEASAATGAGEKKHAGLRLVGDTAHAVIAGIEVVV